MGCDGRHVDPHVATWQQHEGHQGAQTATQAVWCWKAGCGEGLKHHRRLPASLQVIRQLAQGPRHNPPGAAMHH